MARPTSPSEYNIYNVTIRSERFDEPYEIAALIAEINLFESLAVPYINGTIMFVDSAGLSSRINFQGQEKLTLVWSVDDDEVITQEFIIYGVANTSKAPSNQNSNVILNIIEPHGYNSRFRRINRAYNGKFHNTIKDVFHDYLEIDIDDENLDEPHQEGRVLANNKTPLEFTEMLKSRSTTDLGEPFFLYSTIKDGVKFKSIASMNNSGVANPNNPYKYTRVFAETDDIFNDDAYRIMSLTLGSSDDMMELTSSHAIATDHITLNTFRRGGRVADTRTSHNIVDNFFRRLRAGTLINNNNHNTFDDQFTIGNAEETLINNDRPVVCTVNTSDMFDGGSIALDEEPIIANNVKRVEREAILAQLNKEPIDIIIPGYNMAFGDNSTSVGTIIDVQIPIDRPQTTQLSEEDILDTKRSGQYLITACRHKLDGNGGYYAALRLQRAESPDDLIDSTDRDVT